MDEVNFGLLNGPEPVYDDDSAHTPTGQTQRLTNSAVDVDGWPDTAETRNARQEKQKVRTCPPLPLKEGVRLYDANPECLEYIAEDASALAAAANLHKCTMTCSKYAKAKTKPNTPDAQDCRFGFKDGKVILNRGSIKNGRAVVYCDGTLEIDGERVEVDGPNDESASMRLKEEIDRATMAREQARLDGTPQNEDDDDFIIRIRRGPTHINSYNWIIQQAIRSNMDIKVRVATVHP